MAASVEDSSITVMWREDEAQIDLSDVIDSQGSVSEFADMLVADKVQFATWWSIGVSTSFATRPIILHALVYSVYCIDMINSKQFVRFSIALKVGGHAAGLVVGWSNFRCTLAAFFVQSSLQSTRAKRISACYVI